MASSPPQRPISPTSVCVQLWSVLGIHLTHLALDLAGAAHAGTVCVTPTRQEQGPECLGPGAHGAAVWE